MNLTYLCLAGIVLIMGIYGIIWCILITGKKKYIPLRKADNEATPKRPKPPRTEYK